MRRVRRGGGCRLLLGLLILVDDGEAGKPRGSPGIAHDGVGVVEELVDGHGVRNLAAVVVAGLDGCLQIAPGDLCGERVRDDVAGAALLLDPGGAFHDEHFNRLAADTSSTSGWHGNH